MTSPFADVEQPAGGLWLSPGKRVGHLIAITDVESKETAFDSLSKRDVIIAKFRFVDLDAEQELLNGQDNHAGITNKLRVDNPKVVLGRITQLPPKQPNFDPTLILGEHNDADLERFRAWATAWSTSQPMQSAASSTGPVTAPPPAGPATGRPATPTPTPAPVPADAAAPAAAALDIENMDAATLALIQQRLSQLTPNSSQT